MLRRHRFLACQFACLALAVGLMLPAGAGPAQAEKRVALVIGNSTYQNAPSLPNPVRDANLIAAKFREAKFDVVSAKNNLGSLEFKRALQEFQTQAESADIAVIYFAGHGIQVRDMNYLVPIDARLATEVAAKDEAISLDRMVEALEPAKKLRLVILDACRDNPFAKTMRRPTTRSTGAGLARLEPTLGDSLIAYAAKAGTTAEDGVGENSPFAKAVANHLLTQGLDVRLAFGRVRDEVLKATGNKQEPFVAGSIGGGVISLYPAPEGPKVDIAAMKGDFELVRDIGTKRAYETFINNYKSGFYVELAREQLVKLAALEPASPAPAATPAPAAAAAPVAAPAAAPVAKPTAEEQRNWNRIRNSNDPGPLQAFINRYPKSPLVAAAQDRFDAVERAAQEKQAALERAAQEKQAALERAAQEREDKARAERETKAVEAERAKVTEACKRDEDMFDTLKKAGTQGWVRADLRRLERELTCERLRPAVAAALASFGETAVKPVSNTPELVRTAQRELSRVGCFAGAADGNLNDATKTAIGRYLSAQGRPATEVEVTEGFVSDLRQRTRVCPLTCPAGEVLSGERCIAAAKPPAPAAAAKPAPPAAAAKPAPQKSPQKEAKSKPSKREAKSSERSESRTRVSSGSQSQGGRAGGAAFGPGVGF